MKTNYTGIMGEKPFRKKSSFFKHVDHLVPGNAVPVLAVHIVRNHSGIWLEYERPLKKLPGGSDRFYPRC